MRTESEMMDLITEVAINDDRIRAVYMNGSRADDNAPKDDIADYDIVYVVNETKPFYEDEEFIYRFGEVLYKQEPDKVDKSLGKDVNYDEHYTWLVIYTDGNRIDLTVEPAAKCNVYNDSICKVILDKDNILSDVGPSSDMNRWVKKPDSALFEAVCNEFWWCLNNVIKGIHRYELTYAQDMLNYWVRPQLMKMLSWKVGILTDFKVNVGKSGKYMNKWLEESEWELFLETYSSAVAGEMLRSVKIMCDMFDDVAVYVALKLGYVYNLNDSEGARKYMEIVGRM